MLTQKGFQRTARTRENRGDIIGIQVKGVEKRQAGDMKNAFSGNLSIGGNVSTLQKRLLSCHHVTMKVIGNAPCADGVRIWWCETISRHSDGQINRRESRKSVPSTMLEPEK